MPPINCANLLRWSRSALLPLLLFFTLIALRADQSVVPADMVIRHARVYTVDESHPWAEAVAVRGERIEWVGADADVAAHIGSATKVVDAGGRMLLPGFIDSHFHVLLGGSPDVLRIENGNTLHEIQRQVKGFAEKRPALKWIEVEGWNYS